MEMGSCQCHRMDTADAVFHRRLYDFLRSFLKILSFLFEQTPIYNMEQFL